MHLHKSLVLTTFSNDELVHEALRRRSDFVLKNTRPTHLLEVLAVMAAGAACSRRRSPGA